MGELGLAVRALAGRCDYARTLDGAGFNGVDAALGHRLADTPENLWTPRERFVAWKMLKKYAGQLAGLGVEYEKLVAPQNPGARRIRCDGQSLIITFDFDRALVDAVRLLPGRRWDSMSKCWTVPVSAFEAVQAFAETHGFELVGPAPVVDPTVVAPTADPEDLVPVRVLSCDGQAVKIQFDYDAAMVEVMRTLPGRKWDKPNKTWIVPLSLETADALLALVAKHGFAWDNGSLEQFEARVAALHGNTAASAATNAALEIAGLGGTLRPFQKAGVAYAITNKRLFIADEMGLGKTVEALATLQAAAAYPALVICPASLKLNWARETRKWLPGHSVSVVMPGTANYRADVVIVNYDILTRRLDGLKRIKWSAVVLDESHYIKSSDAKRTKAAKELAQGAPYRLLLSGTPLLNRPLELVQQLEALGRLGEFGGYKGFIYRYCNAKSGYRGMDVNGASNLQELNSLLRQRCYIRRDKAEVLKELPAKVHAAVPLDLDNLAEYNRAEEDIAGWVGEQAAKEAMYQARAEGLSEQDAIEAGMDAGAIAQHKALQAEQLVRIEALKQLAVTGKLAAAKEWIADFLESGQKLVVFAHHVWVQKALYEAFPGAARLFAGDSITERQVQVDRFQTDTDCRLMVCSLVAGGVGITLTAASNVAFLELGWTPATHSQAEDRTHRIGQDKSVTAWYLLAAGTIDEEIEKLLEEKRAVVDAATDGRVDGGSTSILAELLARMKAKHGGEHEAGRIGDAA